MFYMQNRSHEATAAAASSYIKGSPQRSQAKSGQIKITFDRLFPVCQKYWLRRGTSQVDTNVVREVIACVN